MNNCLYHNTFFCHWLMECHEFPLHCYCYNSSHSHESSRFYDKQIVLHCQNHSHPHESMIFGHKLITVLALVPCTKRTQKDFQLYTTVLVTWLAHLPIMHICYYSCTNFVLNAHPRHGFPTLNLLNVLNVIKYVSIFEYALSSPVILQLSMYYYLP